MAAALRSLGIAVTEVDIDLLEVDAKGAELGRHRLAEMAAAAPVQPSLCQ